MKGEILFILSKWVNVRMINSRYTEGTTCISYLRICLFQCYRSYGTVLLTLLLITCYLNYYIDSNIFDIEMVIFLFMACILYKINKKRLNTSD